MSNLSDETVESITTDPDGNVYLLAPVGTNGLQIDGIPKEGFYTRDYMIGSFSCGGTYRWSRVIGGGGDDVVNRIQTDNQGNVYAAGAVYRTSLTIPVHFGGETAGVYDTILPSTNSSDNTNKRNLFLVKYNQAGQMQWLKMPQPDNVSYTDALYSRSYDVQTDPQGNSYWLLSIPPGTYADGAFVNTATGYNLFIFKYDASGAFIQATPLDMVLPSYNPNFKMVRNHATGRLYIGGYTIEGDGIAQPIVGGEAITHYMYLAAFSSAGTFLWKKENTHELTGMIHDMCIDSQDNIYLTGGTWTGDTFAGATITSSGPGDTQYVIKLTADGALAWSTNATNPTSARAYGITINGNEVAIASYANSVSWGGITLTGVPNAGTDVFFARFNKADGSVINLHKLESNAGTDEHGRSITADAYGNYYIGGLFDSFLYVADDTLIDSAQGYDFFVAKFGTANCDCAPPIPNFGITIDAGNSLAYTFNYTGDAYTSIAWDFGDGTTSADESPVHTFASANTYTVCVVVTNACGTAQYCTEIQAMLGLNNVQLASVQVYPNPVADELTIKATEDLQYTLYSVTGAQLQSGSLTAGTSQLHLPAIAQGSYLLKLQNANGDQKTVKVFKK